MFLHEPSRGDGAPDTASRLSLPPPPPCLPPSLCLSVCLSKNLSHPCGNTKPPLFVIVARRFGPLALLQLLLTRQISHRHYKGLQYKQMAPSACTVNPYNVCEKFVWLEVTEEGPVVRNVLQLSRTTEALCCHGGRDKFLNCFSSAFSPD